MPDHETLENLLRLTVLAVAIVLAGIGVATGSAGGPARWDSPHAMNAPSP